MELFWKPIRQGQPLTVNGLRSRFGQLSGCHPSLPSELVSWFDLTAAVRALRASGQEAARSDVGGFQRLQGARRSQGLVARHLWHGSCTTGRNSPTARRFLVRARREWRHCQCTVVPWTRALRQSVCRRICQHPSNWGACFVAGAQRCLLCSVMLSA